MDGNCTSCVIGLYYGVCSQNLVDLPDLEYHISEDKEFNEWCRSHGYRHMLHKEFTLQDYADGRKRTNLTRFKHCPMCGKKINWKEIRTMESEDRFN